MDFTESNNVLLRMTIEATVPFSIFDLQQCGGPTQTDWDWLADQVDVMALGGQAVLYRSGRKEQPSTHQAMSTLLRALTIMAFAPGGITFGDQHFEAGNGHT